MGDIFQEIEEDLRRDRVDALWKRYGTAIITLAAVIVLATAGWVAWQQYQTRQNVSATAALHTALSAALAEFAAISETGNSGQATLALFQEAALRAADGDRDNARVLYRNILGNDDVGAPYHALAAIRLAELDLADGDPAATLGLLQPWMGDDSPWRFTAWELAGYVEQRAGNVEAARGHMQRILDDSTASAAARARAEAFLAQL
ncbi:MAG: tetratricopeptide repeat protein [Alphaproteobacteria bacterium]|nr:tetratricopeptide repeat protein [Alphaproteobacteria bacterium]